MHIIKHKRVPEGFQMVSFDVKSLFTNLTLETTINIILRRIYTNHELKTSLTIKEMKGLLLLCTKNVHFTFNGQICTQVDRVAMGTPLAPLLSDIFMIELEISLISNLRNTKFWRRYVDDTIYFAKIGSIEHIRSVLNSFHKNIQFTYEVESNAKLPFLDMLLMLNHNDITTTVYRKEVNSDVYLQWDSITPVSWEKGTLKTLVEREYLICSIPSLLGKKLKLIRTVFRNTTGYPNWIINQVFKQVKAKQRDPMPNSNVSNEIEAAQTSNQTIVEKHDDKKHLLMIPYQGGKGEQVIKSVRKTIKRLLPSNIKVSFTKTTCNDNYIGDFFY